LNSSYFSNGVFSNGGAQAIVAVNQTDHTLAIAFRGTDSNGDLFFTDPLGGLASFQPQYDLFSDLIDAALAFANDPSQQVTHILVTGHSLGGALAEIFMSDHLGTNISGVTFGSPGEMSIANSPNSDLRRLNFWHTGDPVHDAASSNDATSCRSGATPCP
jgi:pimeloyl-ACP methyl ester carboxylesterase